MVYWIDPSDLSILEFGFHLASEYGMTWYIYQETTEWKTDFQPNHIYVFRERLSGRSAKAVAYVRQGNNKVEKFSKPMQIDLKDRQFELLTE